MKTLNVFAIILAWVLSIVMVLMLIGAPLTMSALSLLNTENIVDIVSQVLLGDDKTAAVQPRDEFVVQSLSAETGEVTEEAPTTGVNAGLDMSGLQQIVGDQVMFEKLLASDAMKELLEAYTKDLTNAFAGKNAEKQFTPEMLAEVVEENLDEIVEIVASSGTPLTEEQKEQLKEQIKIGVVEKSEEIVEEMPSAEEIKESVLESDESLGIVFVILAKRNQIKAAIVGVIVVISALIFALRFSGFRGMRWLSIDLFVAGFINGMICKAFGAGTVKSLGITNSLGDSAEGVVESLVARLAQGMLIRTVVIFVAAIGLLIGYILVKKFMGKKKMAVAAPVAEEIIPEAAPAFVPTPVTMETEQVGETVQVQEPVEEPVSLEEV